MKAKFILSLMVVMLAAPALAEGGGIVLTIDKDETLQKFNNSFMEPKPGVNVEFFVDAIPAPNSKEGSFNMDNASDLGDKWQYDYSDNIPGGKQPVINGKNIYIRSWDGGIRKQGSYYGKSTAYKASQNAPAAQHVVNPFKTEYLADVPKAAPTFGTITESTERIGDTQNVKLNLEVAFSYNQGTPKIEATGYDVKYWIEPYDPKDGAAETEPADEDVNRVISTLSPFTLPAVDPKTSKAFPRGTYHFKVRAKNWYGAGPWSNQLDWPTLGAAAGPGATVIQYNFPAAGIHQFALSVDPAKEGFQVNGATLSENTVAAFLKALKSSQINTFGWWDGEKPVGYIITWEGTNPTYQRINDAPADGNTPLVMDRVYQMAISEPLTFTISGTR